MGTKGHRPLQTLPSVRLHRLLGQTWLEERWSRRGVGSYCGPRNDKRTAAAAAAGAGAAANAAAAAPAAAAADLGLIRHK